MITYVNSKDAKLFELAAEALGEESLDVEQYLNRLSALTAISPRFVRLPLYEEGHEDEEIFVIDANARTIKVPASFAKNGVGVVSDELAETVWFKINRYFDIKDFGQAVGHDNSTNLKDKELHILIQWEAPDGAKGASWAYAIDKDTDDDFIYFGWALTAEHLTKKAGNIKFAVRILQFDLAGELAYSFATQVAQVAIKPTLDFDIASGEFGIEEVADKIANRIMDGRIAFCPVFTENGNLPKYIANLTDGERLTVEAEAPTGMEDGYDAMAYIWYKKGANDADFAEVPLTENNGQYTPALAVTESGQYYVVVFGMVQVVDNTAYTYDAESDPAVSAQKEPFWYHSSVASSKSNICEIPAPIALDIESDWAERFILGEEDPDELVIVLAGRQKILNDQTVGVIDLKIEKTASIDKDIVNPVFEPVEGKINFSIDADDVTIRVNMSDLAFKPVAAEATFDENEEYYILVDGAYQIAEISEFAEDVQYFTKVAATPGYYKATVINQLNGNEEETISSVICRVTNPPVIPGGFGVQVLLDGGAIAERDYRPNISAGDSIQAIHNNVTREESDELVYEWYFMKGNAPDDEYEDELVEGAESAIFKPAREGNYYVKLINKLNGVSVEAISDPVGFGA